MKQPVQGPKINAPLPKGQKINCEEGRKGSQNSHHNGSNG